MNSRYRFEVVLAIIILFTGCSALPMHDSSNRSVYLEGKTVSTESVPENATVVSSSDERLEDVPVLQEFLNQTVANERATRELTEEEQQRVSETFETLPEYTSATEPNGYYIDHDGTVVRVTRAYEE